MKRRLFVPGYGNVGRGPLPVVGGGTGAGSAPGALTALGAVPSNKLNQPNGVAAYDADGKLSGNIVPASGLYGPTVQGPSVLAVGATGIYTITNFDSKVTYNVSATVGTVSVNGDTITYVAPGTAQTGGFTVNGLAETVNVVVVKPAGPVIISPVNGAINQPATVLMTCTSFVLNNASFTDTFELTEWQIDENINFTGPTTQTTYGYNTGWSVGENKTYYIRARHKGVNYGFGDWGPVSSFSTKIAFVATTQQAKLVASDRTTYDQFGYSIALSGDGTTCAVGAHGNYVTYTEQGSAYIFTRSGTTWTQQAKLVASDGAVNDRFGYSVALSSDGTTCAVGAVNDDVGANNNQGSAYIFTRSGTTWTQQAKLVASDGAVGDFFGYSIALSSDGNTCAVGAYGDDVTYTEQGSAYIFTRSGSTWTQQTKLTASDGVTYAYFGISIALSSDGNTCAVGAYQDDVTYTDQGSAYIFTRSGSTWTQQAKLVASDAATGDGFGISIALSSDGNTCAVGAYQDDVGTLIDQGSAYIFTRSGSTWTQQARLVANDGAAGDNFGYSIALSSDGNTCAVGAYRDDSFRGSAYIFTRSGSTWTQRAKPMAGDGAASDNFGISIALSSDGNTCAVGADGDDSNRGSAYIFV